MAAMDEFREERNAIKNADLKTKLEYFFDYYKWHVVIAIGVIVLSVSLLSAFLSKKETALNGYFINAQSEIFNSDTTHSDAMSAEFAEIAGIDLNEYDLYLDATLQYAAPGNDEASMMTVQRLSVTVAAQETDFIAADDASFGEFYHMSGFYDLRDIYSEDVLEQYADYLYYVDMEIIRQEEAALDTGVMYTSTEYDHYAPEEMVDPVPIAFCVEDSSKLEGLYEGYEGRVPLGITQSGKKLDTTLQFVDYLLEGIAE